MCLLVFKSFKNKAHQWVAEWVGWGCGTTCVLKPISKKHFCDPLANLFIQLLFTLTFHEIIIFCYKQLWLDHIWFVFTSVFFTGHSGIILRSYHERSHWEQLYQAEVPGEKFVVVYSGCLSQRNRSQLSAKHEQDF